jgi:hypothetical protein
MGRVRARSAIDQQPRRIARLGGLLRDGALGQVVLVRRKSMPEDGGRRQGNGSFVAN